MKCVICKNGDTEKASTTITFVRDNSTIIFKQVPAMICDNCGEKYIDGNITKSLLKNAETIANSGVEIDVRNYHLNSAA